MLFPFHREQWCSLPSLHVLAVVKGSSTVEQMSNPYIRSFVVGLKNAWAALLRGPTGAYALRSSSDNLLTFNKWRLTSPIETWEVSFLESTLFKFNWLASSKNSSVAVYAFRCWWHTLCNLKCLLLKGVSVWARVQVVATEWKNAGILSMN
jgi:hypothetical protein